MKFYTGLLLRNSSLCVNYYFNHPLEEPVYTQEYIANYLCKRHQDGPPPLPAHPYLTLSFYGKDLFPWPVYLGSSDTLFCLSWIPSAHMVNFLMKLV